jgi:hypothetical protein
MRLNSTLTVSTERVVFVSANRASLTFAPKYFPDVITCQLGCALPTLSIAVAPILLYIYLIVITNKSVTLSPRANYTDRATATCRRNLVPTCVDRGVSRGLPGGSYTAVNLSFVDRSRYFSFK